MFKRDVLSIKEILDNFLRKEGLESPLMEKRLIKAWPIVVGSGINRYTKNLFIKNQTLFVQLISPAMRADLSMMQKQLTLKLNKYVGCQVITGIRFY